MRPRRPVQPRRELISFVGQLALTIWCALGTVHTAVALSRWGTGLLSTAGDPAVRAIGVPLQPGSRLVARILALIEDAAPGAAPVLVVLPDSTDGLTRHLARQQLAHLAYPRRLDVPAAAGTAEAARSSAGYGFAVSFGTLRSAGRWEIIDQRDGLTLYRRRTR